MSHSTDSTERLISRLAEDLRPVRPLPRLRVAFAVVMAIWAALLGVVLFGSDAGGGVRSVLGDRLYLASFVGLLVAALGSTASALAASIPGRSRLEMGGLIVALAGLVSAATGCLIVMQAAGSSISTGPPGLDAMCFRHAVVFSLLPAGVILSFLVRGWASHPARAALVALLASGALGALIVHLNCGFVEPRHVLLGHLSVPIVLGALGLYPLGALLRHLRG